MLFIEIITNKKLTLQQEISIKNFIYDVIQNDEYMIHIEDNQVMYYKGKEFECMKIHIQININHFVIKKDELARSIIELISDITHISVNHIYITIDEVHLLQIGNI